MSAHGDGAAGVPDEGSADAHDGPRAPGHLPRDATPAELRGRGHKAGIVRDVGVVIVAAGSGSRVGGTELKQFRWVAGKPMLLHSLQTFQRRADVALVVCVLPKAFAGDPPPWIFQCDIDRLLLSVGGRERTESVFNGLEDMPEEADYVPVHDTLKAVDDEGRIVATVDRAPLRRVQTPQGFPRAMLEQAHLAARRERITATDDAALCERLGFPVVSVRGTERAMKITEEEDFARAEALLVLGG